ncbi:hypothetical protein BDY21DRAFT_180620 [Lineolata rhizophorae]|uniref:Uncharacterized protein n=1 Tax=Lineolata rhizophorae TaxID=578093 RepID=A0A6A6P7P9_9PEZI|nr:hypothetical protein BDY21DRAFT_180620 [Lineolata rhizophorae]
MCVYAHGGCLACCDQGRCGDYLASLKLDRQSEEQTKFCYVGRRRPFPPHRWRVRSCFTTTHLKIRASPAHYQRPVSANDERRPRRDYQALPPPFSSTKSWTNPTASHSPPPRPRGPRPTPTARTYVCPPYRRGVCPRMSYVRTRRRDKQKGARSALDACGTQRGARGAQGAQEALPGKEARSGSTRAYTRAQRVNVARYMHGA